MYHHAPVITYCRTCRKLWKRSWTEDKLSAAWTLKMLAYELQLTCRRMSCENQPTAFIFFPAFWFFMYPRFWEFEWVPAADGMEFSLCGHVWDFHPLVRAEIKMHPMFYCELSSLGIISPRDCQHFCIPMGWLRTHAHENGLNEGDSCDSRNTDSIFASKLALLHFVQWDKGSHNLTLFFYVLASCLWISVLFTTNRLLTNTSLLNTALY